MRAIAARFRELDGTVLEIGAGRGVNFRFLPQRLRWIGLEPDLSLHDVLSEAAAVHGRPAEIIASRAEQIPLGDASVDAVLSTRVLCSVGDPRRVLDEIRRVLRPGGSFVFLEHVAAPRGSWLRRVQRAAAPFSRLLDHGCDPARETGAMIEAAGFAHLELEHFAVRGPFGIPVPHVAGCARL